MKILSRKEAIALGLRRYFTGKPCLNGHVAERFVSSETCSECDLLRRRARYKAHPENELEYSRAYYKANTEKERERKREQYKAAPEKQRKRNRAYAKANPEKFAAASRLRDARKLRAVPIWACKDSIDKFYTKARRLTIETGILHHVDHIVPLKSPIVCGLHVHYNLRAIPATENISKGNRFE